jgi:hypothetical protein
LRSHGLFPLQATFSRGSNELARWEVTNVTRSTIAEPRKFFMPPGEWTLIGPPPPSAETAAGAATADDPKRSRSLSTTERRPRE